MVSSILQIPKDFTTRRVKFLRVQSLPTSERSWDSSGAEDRSVTYGGAVVCSRYGLKQHAAISSRHGVGFLVSWTHQKATLVVMLPYTGDQSFLAA